MRDQEETSAAVRAALIPDEAIRLAGIAGDEGATLRIAGSVGVYLGCPAWRKYLSAMGRRPLYDIDYWARAKDQRKLEGLFEGQGYQADPRVKHMHEWGVKRLIFEHPETGIKVDVFMDELVMAHTISFRERLDNNDGPTVQMPDLLLSKLQIHEITANDLIDMVVILGEHDMTSADTAEADLTYLKAVLGADWGFWYEACRNLANVRDVVGEYEVLGQDKRTVVGRRTEELLSQIEACPKTSTWKRRSRRGAKKRWYELVSEVDR